jgi:hypothetical protein
MFDLLKPGKGFALTFKDGKRVEIDFGPMSHSEKVNSTQKECDHSPASRDAEVRVYTPGNTAPTFMRGNVTVEDLITILANEIIVQ